MFGFESTDGLTAAEAFRLEALWPGGVRHRDTYEIWFTGFGPAMTFTKIANGCFIVTDLAGDFLIGGTDLETTIRAVLTMLNLEPHEIQAEPLQQVA